MLAATVDRVRLARINLLPQPKRRASTAEPCSGLCGDEFANICMYPDGVLAAQADVGATRTSGEDSQQHRIYEIRRPPPRLPRDLRGAVGGVMQAQLCEEGICARWDIWVTNGSRDVSGNSRTTSSSHSSQRMLPSPSNRIGFFVPKISVSLSKNLFHLLHWWLPLLVRARTHGLHPAETRLILVDVPKAWRQGMSPNKLDNWCYGACSEKPWPDDWGMVHHRILSMITDLAILYRPHTSMHSKLRPTREQDSQRPECFQRAVFGIPSMRVLSPQTVRRHKNALFGSLRSGMEALRTDTALRVMLLQRRRVDGRFIIGYDEFQQVIRGWQGVDTIGPLQLETLSIAEQVKLIASTSVLVAAIGAGMTWLFFLPQGGAAIELIPGESPLWVVCVEGWDTSTTSHYGEIAYVAGVHHTCLRMKGDIEGDGTWGPNGVVSYRTLDVVLDLPKLRSATWQAVQRLRRQEAQRSRARRDQRQHSANSSAVVAATAPGRQGGGGVEGNFDEHGETPPTCGWGACRGLEGVAR
eukprot:TRINITY_DN27394_c0_g2_i1.p1 TRINITY_DN27394_c0_g2~~TRINITY_DN27394_c0_g2_i1.p1  ORF type:complete len:584 (+),score=56.94 TRINITY_DN27394_c0_g2_i1:175-1752(+)